MIEGLFAFEKFLRESYIGLEMSARHRRNEHFQGHPGIQTNAKHACKTLLDLSYGNLVDDTSLLIAGEPSGSTQGVHRPKEGQTWESGAASSPIYRMCEFVFWDSTLTFAAGDSLNLSPEKVENLTSGCPFASLLLNCIRFLSKSVFKSQIRFLELPVLCDRTSSRKKRRRLRKCRKSSKDGSPALKHSRLRHFANQL